MISFIVISSGTAYSRRPEALNEVSRFNFIFR